MGKLQLVLGETASRNGEQYPTSSIKQRLDRGENTVRSVSIDYETPAGGTKTPKATSGLQSNATPTNSGEYPQSSPPLPHHLHATMSSVADLRSYDVEPAALHSHTRPRGGAIIQSREAVLNGPSKSFELDCFGRVGRSGEEDECVTLTPASCLACFDGEFGIE